MIGSMATTARLLSRSGSSIYIAAAPTARPPTNVAMLVLMSFPYSHLFGGRLRVVITGAAFYQDRYARGEDGRWRISHTGYVRTYEVMMSLDDAPSLKFTANRWAAGPGSEPGAEQQGAEQRAQPGA